MPRNKGVSNRPIWPLRMKAEELGIDPFEILLHCAAGDWKALGYKEPTKRISIGEGRTMEIDTIELSDRIMAAKEACKYLHPQLKAVAIAADDKTANALAELVKLAQTPATDGN